MAIVYRHVRLDRDETFYIGIGNLEDRAYNNRNRSKWWKRVVDKTDYRVDIIAKDITWEKAVELEKSLIFLYGRKDLDKGTLVNLTDGGEGNIGVIWSEESRLKMSVTRKSRNYKPSKETLEKAAKGKRENGLRIKELTTGVEFNLYDSEKYFDIPKTTIRQNCYTGNPLRYKKYNGLNFTLLKGRNKKDKILLDILPIIKTEIPKYSRIVLDTETGIFYNSILEASLVYNIKYDTLQRQLRGQYKNKTNLIIV